MNFLIVTHVPHRIDENRYSAYAPYVNEMNVWTKQVKQLTIIAPLELGLKTAIDTFYQHPNITFIAVDSFDFLGASNSRRAIRLIPKIIWQMYKAMLASDHIHLRCPGNMGLIGCFVQLLFPQKNKTAKYAGNWDPTAQKPWTYRLQQKILNNTFLTRNIQVLIYGEWEGQTKNSKSFFTATYSKKEMESVRIPSKINSFQFVFVGTLVKGKNPLYAIKLVEKLKELGHAVSLKVYGEGVERNDLEKYSSSHNLDSFISLEGNKNREEVKQAYQDSDFVVLPSDSEGWPKAIAEGMFWGCIPIAAPVSCVPYMLDFGKRGLLLEMDLDKDTAELTQLLSDLDAIKQKRNLATNWSRQYTLERFETELKTLLQS